jgi:LAO/AO transport system kinase
VGVGQAEVDIANAAHTTVVVEAPGLGDEVQAIKAGVLEIADVFAVNKADRAGADHTVTALQMMQGLAVAAAGHHGATEEANRSPRVKAGVQPDGAWLPPITKTVAVRSEGIEPLREWIELHAHYLRATGRLAQRELVRAANELDHILRNQLLAALSARLPPGHLDAIVAAIAHRRIDPYTAASQLLAQFV